MNVRPGFLLLLSVLLTATLPLFSAPFSEDPPTVPLSKLQKDSDFLPTLMAQMGENDFRVARIADSGSMKPVLDDFDYVVVVPAPFEAIARNDIVIRKGRPGVYACHRVSLTGRNRHLTKGDSNEYHDSGYLTSDNYGGRVVLVLSNDLGTHPVSVLRGAKYLLAQNEVAFVGRE